MIRRPPRSTRVRSSAASDVYKRQVLRHAHLRPVAARLRDGGQGGRGGRARLRLQPARLQADAGRRRPARQRHRAAGLTAAAALRLRRPSGERISSRYGCPVARVDFEHMFDHGTIVGTRERAAVLALMARRKVEWNRLAGSIEEAGSALTLLEQLDGTGDSRLFPVESAQVTLDCLLY